MTSLTSGSSSNFESVGERMSRVLAGRISRRSLLAELGKGSILLSTVGIGGTLVLDQTDAEAHAACPCPNGCGATISCADLTGDNACPSGTCGCGWWVTCDQSQCTYRKVWSDCCSTGSACDGGAQCVNGQPTCYWHKLYDCGCGTASAHNKCRRWYCTGGGSCSEVCG